MSNFSHVSQNLRFCSSRTLRIFFFLDDHSHFFLGIVCSSFDSFSHTMSHLLSKFTHAFREWRKDPVSCSLSMYFFFCLFAGRLVFVNLRFCWLSLDVVELFVWKSICLYANRCRRHPRNLEGHQGQHATPSNLLDLQNDLNFVLHGNVRKHPKIRRKNCRNRGEEIY